MSTGRRWGFDVVSALRADATTVWRQVVTGVDPHDEIEPGRRRVQRSESPTQRFWQHERVVTRDGDGARLTDRLRFAARIDALGAIDWATFRAAFAWRHRRARRRFGSRPLRFGLETPRLSVRPWRTTDHGALRALATDPAVMRFVGDGRPWTDEDVGELIARQTRLVAARGLCLGAIVERATDEIVGLGGLQPLGSTDDVEVGWWLSPSRWGRGYATEMGAAAVRYAFDVVGVERVVAIVHPGNAASRRVAGRIGLRSEGSARGEDLGLRVPDVVVDLLVRERHDVAPEPIA